MGQPTLNLLLLAGLFVSLRAVLEIGRRAGRIAFARTDPGERPAGLSTVETVAFGLLGLLLAFTFSGAATRLDSVAGLIRVDDSDQLIVASDDGVIDYTCARECSALPAFTLG